MQKILLLTALLAISAGLLACGSAEPTSNQNVTNLNSAQADANRPVNVDPANLPPGFDTKPLQPSANSTPGIPADGQANLKVDPNVEIPGIPNAANLNKPMKPGPNPTPGIPDPETLKRQLKEVHKDANVPPPPPNAPGSTGARKQVKPVSQ